MSAEDAAGRAAGNARGQRTRDELAAAAAAAYGDIGYDAASLREIAKRAGITHAGLLYHFPNKEALLAAVLERRDTLDAARPDPAPSAMPAPLARLLDLAAHNQRNRGIVELYVRLAAEATSPAHPAHGYFTKHYEVARGYAAQGFRLLRDEGRLRAGVDPDVAAAGLVALMDGLQVQWLTDPGRVDLTTALRQFVEESLTDSADPAPLAPG